MTSPPRPVVHALTPGDHFSPSTGSAIPTVVHGLARAATAAGDARHQVVVERGTYEDRYDSADVIECAPSPYPSRLERLQDAVAGRLGMPRAAAARQYAATVEALRDRPPSVVLAHNAPVLPRLLQDGPHQVVLYAHNDLLRTYSRREAGRMLDSAAAVVCVSEDLAARTRARLPQRLADRVVVVGNGIDVDQFEPRTARPAGPVRVMFVGRVIREKGVDVLLDAAKRLSRDVEVVIVGSAGFDAGAPLTAYEEGLRRSARALRSPVQFLPFVDRAALPALLRTADVLVVPSRWAEPSGLTVAEGMASGLPVVASRVGGIPEVLGDAGLLVGPDAPDELASALQALVADPARRAELGRKARARAEERDWSWSWDRLRRLLAERCI